MTTSSKLRARLCDNVDLLGAFAPANHGAGFAVAAGDDKAVASFGQGAEAQNLRRGAGGNFVDVLALVVNHGADTPEGIAGHDVVSHGQRAVYNQHGGGGAALAVQFGFDDDARRLLVGVGFQFGNLGYQLQVLQQVVYALSGAGGNVDRYDVAAPVLHQQLVLTELTLDPLRVCAGQVHLVDGDHDGNLSCLGVVYGLYGLGHYAVVGSHHQHRYVGDTGSAGANGGEGGMAWGVQEGDGAASGLHLVGPHVLGDAADFAVGHVGILDVVQAARSCRGLRGPSPPPPEGGRLGTSSSSSSASSDALTEAVVVSGAMLVRIPKAVVTRVATW